MSVVGTPKSAEQIQQEWDTNPRWKDVTRSPNRIPSTSSMAYPSNSRLAWVISTPLGFPVVPDV